METKYLVVYLIRMYRVCFVRQSIHVQFEFKFVCYLYFVFIVIIFEILIFILKFGSPPALQFGEM